MVRHALPTAGVVLLAACSRHVGPTVMDDKAVQAGARPSPAAAAAPQAPAPAAATLAYAYMMEVEAPEPRIAGLLQAHAEACRAAGPAVCQITGSELAAPVQGGGAESTLNLRAVPDWIVRFRADLPRSAQALGGEVTADRTASEDVGRSLVDTAAALRAKTTLRDRLQDLLATHPGNIKDLLELETALSNAQGELDTATSELAALHQRVDTSTLALTYSPRSLPGLGLAAGSAKALEVTLLVLAPWAAVGALVWLAVAALSRRRQSRKPPPQPPLKLADGG